MRHRVCAASCAGLRRWVTHGGETTRPRAGAAAGGRSRRHQRGSTLIEILVALVLTAIGMLGLAGTIVATVGLHKVAEHRSTAALLAEDIAERMRANADGARDGGYALSAPFAAALAPGVGDCSATQACAPAVLAASELAEWTARLRQSLPSGTGHIRVDAALWVADVWVAWVDPVGALQPPRPPGECPALFGDALPAPRCLHLKVAL